MATLPERIKDCRLLKDVTLLDVANHIGVKEATMQRYESGKIKNIKHETVCALADYFGVSPQYLMGWTDDPRPRDKGPIEPEPVSPAEAELIFLYRSVNEQGQDLISANARMIAGMEDFHQFPDWKPMKFPPDTKGLFGRKKKIPINDERNKGGKK